MVKREEAVAYMKEILSLGDHISLDSIHFEESSCDDPSIGYRVHVKGVQEEDKKKVCQIAKWHDIMVKMDNDEVILYKPKNKTKP